MMAADAPQAAQRLFGDRFDKACKYAAMLSSAGVKRGLIGPREPSRVWERHLLNCAVVGELLPAEVHVVDVGSGAGLPGIVLALVRTDITVTLVEPMLRRAEFLRECVEQLGLHGIRVERARAPGCADEIVGDLVTCRALGRLAAVVRWCLPVVRPGGAVLAMKGASVGAELAEVGVRMRGDRVVHIPQRLARQGVDAVDVVGVGCGIIDPVTTVVRVRTHDARG